MLPIPALLSRLAPVAAPALILTLALTGCATTPPRAAAPAEAKGQALFDGKTLTGWSGMPSHWMVKDGAITGFTTAANPIKNNTFLVWTNGTVADFELHLKYRIQGGNSGIQYRSELKDPAEFIVGGYQADIDATPRYSGILYEERGRGILAERGQRTVVKDQDGKTTVKVVGTLGTPEFLQTLIHSDSQWNEYTIVARGNQVLHFINGHLMSDCIDFGETRAQEGVLALQIHVGPPMQVQFKDIVLFPLPKAEPTSNLPATNSPAATAPAKKSSTF